MDTSIDRRVFYRIEGEIGIRYSLPDNNKGYYTTTKNISGGGISILLSRRFSPGTVLNLEIFKPNSNISARCKGEIIWIYSLTMDKNKKGSFEAGIKFIDMDFLYIGSLINDLEARSTERHLSNELF